MASVLASPFHTKKNPMQQPAERLPNHPRKLGWLSTTALAMGGSNQSLFLLTALFSGQGAISGQGSEIGERRVGKEC